MIVLVKNPNIKELSGSRIEFFHPFSLAGKDVVLEGAKANKVIIPFSAKILAGGKLDLDFALSERLAAVAVNLLGAYWNGKEVTAYLMPLEGMDVHIPSDCPLVVGTLVQVTTYRQVEEGVAGAVVTGHDNGVLQITKDETPKAKRTRRVKK
jgi:hypothetical protein